jgi:exopolyphosphatase / guanosine-5'-triphosphate,3'-diphosphate pyrophosphatase
VKRIAAIDIGSNAIRDSVAEITDDWDYKILYRNRIPLRLGDEAFSQGRISDYTIEKCLNTFWKLRQKFESYNVSMIRAVATSALRNSENRKDFIKQIFDKTGIVIHIIDGFHEAKLIYQAVRSTMDLTRGKYLIMDLGGGSLELTAVNEGRFVECHTFKLGALRLQHLQNESPLKKQEHIDQKRESIVKFLESCFGGNYHDVQLIGTGGNPRRMGKLRKRYLECATSELVHLDEMKYFHNELKDLSLLGRVKKFDLRMDRADVIYQALEVFIMMSELVGTNKIDLPKVGLINGIFEDVLHTEMNH